MTPELKKEVLMPKVSAVLVAFAYRGGVPAALVTEERMVQGRRRVLRYRVSPIERVR